MDVIKDIEDLARTGGDLNIYNLGVDWWIVQYAPISGTLVEGGGKTIKAALWDVSHKVSALLAARRAEGVTTG